MKTCPVCGAGAFDDAEVCFGCLHRFEKGGIAPADPREGAVTPAPPQLRTPPSSVAPQRLSPTVEQASAAAVQVPVALASAGQTPPPQSTMQAMPVLKEPCIAEAVPLAAPRVVEVPQAASMFDGAGWVVRFEFPGFAPAPPSKRGMEATCGDPGALSRGCALLAENRPGAAGRSCGMVVRFQPEPAGALEEGLCSRPSRGSHARGPAAESRPPDGSGRRP